MEAAFGQMTGCDNSHLFLSLRNMSLTRDPNAPIKLSPDEWQEWESRADATTLRTAITEAPEGIDASYLKQLVSRFKYLRNSWGVLKLADNRSKYFEIADRA